MTVSPVCRSVTAGDRVLTPGDRQAAERHAALTDQLSAQLDWLHERQTAIQSRPVFTMDDAEVQRHSQESQVRTCSSAQNPLS